MITFLGSGCFTIYLLFTVISKTTNMVKYNLSTKFSATMWGFPPAPYSALNASFIPLLVITGFIAAVVAVIIIIL